jgi:hypothetical protein
LTLGVVQKYMRVTDREVMDKSYDRYIPENKLPRKQYPTLPGIATVLKTIDLPKSKSIKPEDLVDDQFVRQLDQSGFTDGLYKR